MASASSRPHGVRVQDGSQQNATGYSHRDNLTEAAKAVERMSVKAGGEWDDTYCERLAKDLRGLAADGVASPGEQQ